jgi:predicted kinase
MGELIADKKGQGKGHTYKRVVERHGGPIGVRCDDGRRELKGSEREIDIDLGKKMASEAAYGGS